MPILDLQRRMMEIGRLRIGQQVATRGGKKRPEKLDTWRFTSRNKTVIEQAANRYGGKVQPWEAPSGPQWECISTSDSLKVLVPPTDLAFSQFYELWSGGGCLRRCDGISELISDGPCVCDPEARECKAHSRLSVMLADLTGLGVWRVDTQGWYAATELSSAVEVIRMAATRGAVLPAVLRLEQRMVKRVDEPTKKFAVPVLDLAVSPAQLLGGGDPLDAGTLAIEGHGPTYGVPSFDNGPHQGLTAVPDTVPERPTPPIAEQATATRERKPRKNAAKAIPPTGLEPRTAAQAAAEAQPPPPDEPPPADDDSPDPRVRLNRKMHALFREAGIEKDRRDDRLTVTRYLSKRFDIETSNGLTLDELENVAETMGRWKFHGGVAKLTDEVNEIINQAAIDTAQQEENV